MKTFSKLDDIRKDVFQFSINWPSLVSTQDNGWDFGVHVIKHMQTFKNGDPIEAFSISSFIQICWQIAINLVLHEGNKEKQTI
ncbi:unnamed protein product, partial [Vitis vinifera]|uniref:Ubiquitin-like protease family profile domain-containing protein n=1 Tax=Vitis vinifera TaxID=29760 RepID=D7TY49_VITVI